MHGFHLCLLQAGVLRRCPGAVREPGSWSAVDGVGAEGRYRNRHRDRERKKEECRRLTADGHRGSRRKTATRRTGSHLTPTLTDFLSDGPLFLWSRPRVGSLRRLPPLGIPRISWAVGWPLVVSYPAAPPCQILRATFSAEGLPGNLGRPAGGFLPVGATAFPPFPHLPRPRCGGWKGGGTAPDHYVRQAPRAPPSNPSRDAPSRP